MAASAGLVLDPWQAEVLEHGLGERADGKWSAFEVGVVVPRQNGKGAIIEARELAGLFLFGEQLILHSAHEFKTAGEAFRRILGWVEGSADLSRRVKRVSEAHGKEAIELKSGARLRFVARSKGSGRGFSGDLNILDEALMLTAEQMAALMPTMSARENPQLWYFSTPPLEPAAMLVALRKRGAAGARRLAYFEWSPPDDFEPSPKDEPPTVADRDMWAACNPALGIRIAEEFVEAERESLPAEEFARERLGVWPPAAEGQWRIFSEQDWEAGRDETSTLADPVAFGIAVSWDRKFGAILAGGRRPDGLRHVEVVDHRSGTGWIVERVKGLKATHAPCAVVVDRTGPANSLVPDLEEAGIEVLEPSARDAAQAFGAFYDSVAGEDPAGRDLRHRAEPALTVALAPADKRPLGDAFGLERKTDADVSTVEGAMLALWGHAKNGHQLGPVELAGSLMA